MDATTLRQVTKSLLYKHLRKSGYTTQNSIIFASKIVESLPQRAWNNSNSLYNHLLDTSSMLRQVAHTILWEVPESSVTLIY